MTQLICILVQHKILLTQSIFIHPVDAYFSRFLTSYVTWLNTYMLFFLFFNCYLAVPRSTLGHSQGDSLTNPMLSTTIFIHFDPKVFGSLVRRLGPSSRPHA